MRANDVKKGIKTCYLKQSIIKFSFSVQKKHRFPTDCLATQNDQGDN